MVYTKISYFALTFPISIYVIPDNGFNLQMHTYLLMLFFYIINGHIVLLWLVPLDGLTRSIFLGLDLQLIIDILVLSVK
jgi:hypothetical protein